MNFQKLKGLKIYNPNKVNFYVNFEIAIYFFYFF
jgi:hypothetical protein